MNENIFSGKISFGRPAVIDEEKIAFNFELYHKKNYYVGTYRFDPEAEVSEERIELFNNDLRKCYSRLDERKIKKFRSKFHRHIEFSYPEMWVKISDRIFSIHQPLEKIQQEDQTEIFHRKNFCEKVCDDMETDASEINLQSIFDKINLEYFNDEIKSSIS